MKKSAWLFLLVATLVLATTATRASTASFAVLGDNTYSYTREASTTFGRDVDKLVAEAKDDAAKYCAAKGKQVKVISITVEKPWMTLGIPKATVVFKALDAGDPALADNTPVPIVRADKKSKKVEKMDSPAPVMAAPAAPPPAPPVTNLYDELLKLDDLRKRGILTEEEFQAEKKKVLSRSK